VTTPARNEPPVALRRLLPEAAELTAEELVASSHGRSARMSP